MKIEEYMKLKYWRAAGFRIANAEATIPLDNAEAWDKFWEVELARQEREGLKEITDFKNELEAPTISSLFTSLPGRPSASFMSSRLNSRFSA